MSDLQPNLSREFSFSRVLSVLFPVLIIAVGVAAYSNRMEKDAKEDLERTTLWRLIGEQKKSQQLSSEYVDADGDYVADVPQDPTKIQRPEKLKFSYISQSDSSKGDATWKEFLAAIAEKTGQEIEEVEFNSLEEQIDALRKGELHLTAFGTGEVETAVNRAGFVPVACFANEAGEYGYKMQFIVPANSSIKNVNDLRNRRLTFTRPKSNSGCVAPIVLLSNEFGMQLDKDYFFNLSQSHENSIRGIVSGQYEVAAVASDILEGMIKSEPEVNKDKFRVIYESKSYPPGVLGVPHDLDKALVDSFREVFFSFNWAGTGLESAFGGNGNVQFAMVSYKNDWEAVRKLKSAALQLASAVAPEKVDAPPLFEAAK